MWLSLPCIDIGFASSPAVRFGTSISFLLAPVLLKLADWYPCLALHCHRCPPTDATGWHLLSTIGLQHWPPVVLASP